MSRQTFTDYLQKLMFCDNPWLKLESIATLLESLFYVCFVLFCDTLKVWNQVDF